MTRLHTLWSFSRPHTVVGSVISIVTLYAIVCVGQKAEHLPLLIVALLIGITCNIFIVGINQVADVELDRINKPYLPLPSGALSIAQAKVIVYAALAASLGLALLISPYLFGIIALATGIGWAYSMPPFHLKRHHVSAALCITTVRGLLLNAGGFLVFNHIVNGEVHLPQNVKILTLFVVAFSVVIAWFKDLPDVEGDAKFNIRTFALQYSPRAALIAGNVLVSMAYIFTIYMKVLDLRQAALPPMETRVLLLGHVVLFALFILNAASIRLRDPGSVRRYYVRFWWFFFAEYVVYLVAYLLPG
jgi:homogentisate phytyltransferase/homogentisate geranylgeranyltransferase